MFGTHRICCTLICNRHQCSENHERYIQQKESEYILGINHDYIVFHHSFFFSFRRRYVHFRLIRFTEKLLLIVAYLFTHVIQIQTISFWGVIFVFALFYTIARPFRAPASNVALTEMCKLALASSLHVAYINKARDEGSPGRGYLDGLSVKIVLNYLGLALLYTVNNQLTFLCFEVADPGSYALGKSVAPYLCALMLRLTGQRDRLVCGD